MIDIEHSINVNGKLIKILPIDKICEMLKHKFQTQNDQIEYWKSAYTEAEKGIATDKRVKELKERLDEYEKSTFFRITPEEMKEIEKWQKKHQHYLGVVGGNFTYIFTPTSIGEIAEISCECGESLCFRGLE